MNHAQLIKIGQTLGYKEITGTGMCHGFSMMWIQAACIGDLESFNNRMDLLAEYSEKPEKLLLEVNRVRKAVRENQALNPRDLDLLEIPVFFEGASLYQAPFEYYDIFQDNLAQPDAAIISQYTQPTIAKDKLHSKRIYGQYDRQAFQAHITSLVPDLMNKPGVAISFSSSNHTVSVRYIKDNVFELIDTNFDTKADLAITAKHVNIEQLGDSLRKAFKSTVMDDTMVISTSVFSNNPEQIENLAFAGSNKKIDELKVNAQGFTLLHLALSFQDKELFNLRVQSSSEHLFKI